MTYRGVAKGRTIELDDVLPYPEGQVVSVSIEAESKDPLPGSGAAVLKAARQPPHLDAADVDELERIIAEGKLPLAKPIPFDDGE